MYVKPKPRQIQGVFVPDNYNGTTFTEPPVQPTSAAQDTPEPTEDATEQERAHTNRQQCLPESIPTAKPTEKPSLSSLFAGTGGLRSDDLLLLALILLLSRDEGEGKQAAEILPLLALLLFLG